MKPENRLRKARNQIRIVRDGEEDKQDSALELAEVLLDGVLFDLEQEHRLAGAEPSEQDGPTPDEILDNAHEDAQEGGDGR